MSRVSRVSPKSKTPIEWDCRFLERLFFADTRDTLATPCRHSLIPCISRGAKRTCRPLLIFRYLLRPEMMVIHTSNIIYGFSTKSHTTRGGWYTQGAKYTRFSNITPNLRRARGGYTPNPLNPAYHVISRRVRVPPCQIDRISLFVEKPFQSFTTEIPYGNKEAGWVRRH